MTEIQHSGCKLLLGRRMFAAMASSIAAQFVFMSCVILITNLSITHPLSWLGDTLSIITCWRMWCYFVVLAAVMLLQGAIRSKNYLASQPPRSSRFDALLAAFTLHNFVVGSLHVAIGIVLVWLHLSLEDGEYGSLSKHCKNVPGYCLVEEHYFLLLGGLWIGIYHFARTNFAGFSYLEFSPVPRSKLVQFKQGIGALLPLAVLSAVWPALYLLGLYYFLGNYFRAMVASTLFLGIEGESLEGLSALLNPSLLFRAWLYAALFVLTVDTMHLLFRICLTEWIPFEINRKIRFESETRTIGLAEALCMREMPIMQHLAYLDLVTIAQKDRARRAELFALSQPGGHPYNWNRVVEKVLALIAKFTDEIDEACCAKRDETQRTAEKPTIDLSDKPYAYHMRSLIDTRATTTTTKNEAETTKQPNESFVIEYLRYKRDNFISYLLSKPLIFYFFGKRSDGKIRHVLTNGQTIVWASDAISSLAVVSLEEDPYGIVQKDLSSVVENLLSLKRALDKLQKTNILVRKSQNDDKTIRIMLTSLRTAIKRSLYRIVTSFRDYMDDLSLEPSVRNQLQNFLVYRE